jgi:hypothetical protein
VNDRRGGSGRASRVQSATRRRQRRRSEASVVSGMPAKCGGAGSLRSGMQRGSSCSVAALVQKQQAQQQLSDRTARQISPAAAESIRTGPEPRVSHSSTVASSLPAWCPSHRSLCGLVPSALVHSLPCWRVEDEAADGTARCSSVGPSAARAAWADRGREDICRGVVWLGNRWSGCGPHRACSALTGAVPSRRADRAQHSTPRQQQHSPGGQATTPRTTCSPDPTPPTPGRSARTRTPLPSVARAALSGAGTGPVLQCSAWRGPSPPPSALRWRTRQTNNGPN